MSRRLVLIGEGHGEVKALRILVRRLLKEKTAAAEFVVDDGGVIRAGNASHLVKAGRESDLDDREWTRFLELARLRANPGAVLAVFDGDASCFPAGSASPFCAKNAAKQMAELARKCGAGQTFSLAVVFAVKEFESWMIAGADSFRNKFYAEGGPIFRKGAEASRESDPEKQGKRWLEANTIAYRPAIHQHQLAEIVDLELVRAKRVRSFLRLENAIDQLLAASRAERFICTPE